jgi:hypothetical protein
MAVGSAVAALPLTAAATTEVTSGIPTAVAQQLDSGEPPWALLTPFGMGDDVGLGYRIASLSGVKRGGIVLTLVDEAGARVQVHLCQRGDEPRGMSYTQRFDIIIMNGGDGSEITSESIGRVVRTLAECIKHNEQHVDELSGLLQHHTRVSKYGACGILE